MFAFLPRYHSSSHTAAISPSTTHSQSQPTTHHFTTTHHCNTASLVIIQSHYSHVSMLPCSYASIPSSLASQEMFGNHFRTNEIGSLYLVFCILMLYNYYVV